MALKNEGIVELADCFWRHRQFLIDNDRFAEHHFKWEYQYFRHLVTEMVADRIFEETRDSPDYLALVNDLKSRKIDPISAAEKMLRIFIIR